MEGMKKVSNGRTLSAKRIADGEGCYFYGKRASEMSREELLEFIGWISVQKEREMEFVVDNCLRVS